MTLRPTTQELSTSTAIGAHRTAQKAPRRPLRRPAVAVRAAHGGGASLPSAKPKLLPKALEAAFSRNPDIGADIVGAALWEDQPAHHLIEQLSETQQKILVSELERQKFTGKKGERALIPLTHHQRLLHVLLVGLGAPDAAACFDAGRSVARQAARQQAKHVVVVPPQAQGDALDHEALQQLVRGLHLGAYRYTECKSQRPEPLTQRTHIAHPRGGGWSEAARRGIAMAEATALARDLVNKPANMLTPNAFAGIAVNQALLHDLGCHVYGDNELRSMGMHLMSAVGRGSENPPCLVHLTYRPQGLENTRPAVCLVGKGITFDSGGLCIKPGGSMLGMKADMGGAAAVLGAIVGAADRNAPMAIDAVLALAENSIGEGAYRPGDVYTSAAGKTVEIINTDAEGRLVLADALHFARQQGAREIIDVATLTGACIVALGSGTAALFSNDADLTADLQRAAAAVGESIWHMPLSRSLEPELRSPIADLKNLGGSGGGAITAALFLREFVGDTRWAHLDIAGPATNEEGATGFAAATLAEHLCSHRGATLPGEQASRASLDALS